MKKMSRKILLNTEFFPPSLPPPPPPPPPLPQPPRIDGDASGTVLVQTVVSEKETCIVGGQGEAMLLPARELGDYEREQQEQETQENTSPSPPPPTAALPPHPTPTLPPHPTPTLPPPPPPPPPKKQREPWPGQPVWYKHTWSEARTKFPSFNCSS